MKTPTFSGLTNDLQHYVRISYTELHSDKKIKKKKKSMACNVSLSRNSKSLSTFLQTPPVLDFIQINK
jgi:hypothetical protein